MALLQIRGLARSYYGVHALRGVDLSVGARKENKNNETMKEEKNMINQNGLLG